MSVAEREQIKKTMVCEFFDNITPHQRAVDLTTIIQKYASYKAINDQQLSLAGQFVKQIKKHESFFTFREATKARYISNMSDIQRQMEIISSDTLIIDGSYNNYENYLDNNNNNSYIVDKSKFFDLLRNTCNSAVQVTRDDDGDVVTTVIGKNDGKHQGLPLATPVNSNATATAMGLRKSRRRKSIQQKSRKKYKSRK